MGVRRGSCRVLRGSYRVLRGSCSSSGFFRGSWRFLKISWVLRGSWWFLVVLGGSSK